MPLLTEDIFAQLDNGSQGMEYTVRLSAVEVYLNRIRDLLHESSFVHIQSDGTLKGCSSVSCVQPSDVESIVQRAMAVRTSSSASPNRDSTRSSLVFQITLEQFSSQLRCSVISSLQVFDLACSELASLDQLDTEATMVANSLKELQKIVASHTEWKEGSLSPVSNTSPMLLRLMRRFLGGDTHGTVLLAASSSNYSITETVKTIQFGLDFRAIQTYPSSQVVQRWQENHSGAKEMRLLRDRFGMVLYDLAQECKEQRREAGDSFKTKNEHLWKIIDSHQFSNSDREGSCQSIFLKIVDGSDDTPQREISRLESCLGSAERERQRAIAEKEQLQADLAIVQAECAVLREDCARHKKGAMAARNENEGLKVKLTSIEDTLATMDFRQRESVVYLRQIRRFYYRLLKRNEAEGSGEVSRISEKIPGAPCLAQLHGIDQMMFESGLLEKHEVGADVSTKGYEPSAAAMERSGVEAKKSSAPSSTSSPSNIEREQKENHTPSGECMLQREAQLEDDLKKMAEANVRLQMMLDDERANVQAITERVGMAAAFEKLRTAQELKSLKDELNRKTADLKTVIWKMNELHMSSRSASGQLQSKAERIVHLERELIDSRNSNNLELEEQTKKGKLLQTEIERLERMVKGYSTPVWHLGDTTAVPAPLASRIVTPFSAGLPALTRVERRFSTGAYSEKVANSNTDVFSKTDHPDLNSQVISVPSEMDVERAVVIPDRATPMSSIDDLMFMDDESERGATDMPTGSESAVEKKDENTEQQESHLESTSTALGIKKTVPVDENFERTREYVTQPIHSTERKAETVQTSPPLDPKSKSVQATALSDPLLKTAESTLSGLSQSEQPAGDLPTQEHTTNSSNLEATDTATRPFQTWAQISREAELSRERSGPPTATSEKDGLNTCTEAPSSRGILDRLHAQATRRQEQERNATKTDGTPEWMRKFRTIATKNQNEAVIETSGSVPPKEATRTTLEYESPAKKWVPKKRTDDESDDDSFAKQFLSNQADHSSHYHESSSQSEDTNEDSSHFPVEESPNTQNVEAVGSAESDSSDSDSSEKSSKNLPSSTPEVDQKPKEPSKIVADDGTPEWMQKFRTIASKNHDEAVIEASGNVDPKQTRQKLVGETPVKKWTPRRQGTDDDSDDDSFAKQFLGGASNQQPSNQFTEYKGSDSDSDSDDDKSEISEESHSSVDASVKSRITLPEKEDPSQVSESDSSADDSSSDSSLSHDAPKVTKQSSESQSEQLSDDAKKQPGALKVKKDSDLESSDDDDTSSSSDISKISPDTSKVSTTPATKPKPKGRFSDSESDSDDSSSDESTIDDFKQRTDSPTKAPSPARQSPQQEESESSSGDSTVASSSPIRSQNKPSSPEASESSTEESEKVSYYPNGRKVESDASDSDHDFSNDDSDDEEKHKSDPSPVEAKIPTVKDPSESSEESRQPSSASSEGSYSSGNLNKKEATRTESESEYDTSSEDESKDNSASHPSEFANFDSSPRNNASTSETSKGPDSEEPHPFNDGDIDPFAISVHDDDDAFQASAFSTDGGPDEDDFFHKSKSSIGNDSFEQSGFIEDDKSSSQSEDFFSNSKPSNDTFQNSGFMQGHVSNGDDFFAESQPMNVDDSFDSSGFIVGEKDTPEDFFASAKAEDFLPRREVDDFDAAVSPAVTSGSRQPKKQGSDLSQTQFAIKNGKLTKEFSSPTSSGGSVVSRGSKSKVKFSAKKGKLVKHEDVETDSSKAKFVIKNGKLVKGGSLASSDSGSKAKKKTKNKNRKAKEENTTKKAEKRGSTKGSNLLAAVEKAMRETPKPKAAFSIVDGKLTKAVGDQAKKKGTKAKKKKKGTF